MRTDEVYTIVLGLNREVAHNAEAEVTITIGGVAHHYLLAPEGDKDMQQFSWEFQSP